MSTLKIAVCVIHNGSFPQLDRTLASLKKQTVNTFDTRVIYAADFCPVTRNQDTFGADYVLYLYSGSVLEENGLEIMSEAAETGAAWYYFDEKLWADPDGCSEKPDFGMIGFAGSVYIGEAVLFSRDTLENMTLRYEGTNFAAALMEMTIAAALRADGVHIPMPLLTRYGRKAFNPMEHGLLGDALTAYLDTKGACLKSVSKSGAPGLYLFPERKQNAKISFLLFSAADHAETGFELPYVGEGREIIRLTGGESYLKKCLRGAREASGDLLCVIDAGCTLPSRADMERLADFASLPYAGMVSPCLYKEDVVLYAGAFSMAGSPFRFSKTQENMDRLWKDIYSVRETVMPAWQFWMADRELVLRATEAARNIPGADELAPEYAILECAFQAKALGRTCLYIGDVLTRCLHESQAPSPRGFCDMLFRRKDLFAMDSRCPSAMRSRMRETLGKDIKVCFPKQMDAPAPSGKKVMILTHELSLTGAPVVLSHAVPILKEAGWQVVVVSPCDGVLKSAFLQQNVPVLVLGNMDSNTQWLRFAADFDLILVNTVVPFRQIEQLRDLEIPVMWWLHDARSGYEDYLQYALPETLGKNIHTFSVSSYADHAVRTYRPKYETGLLMYGLKDEAELVSPAPPVDTRGRKLFVSVGTVIPRKGQDILAQAIRLLPQSVMDSSLFLFVGKPMDPEIFKHVKALEQDYPDSVRHVGSIPHDEIFALYKQASAVICSSRDDPLPTFMAETMMMSGVCICSENTGMANVITHGKNGYLYADDDPEKLAACIQTVAQQDDQTEIRREARKLFEEAFTMEIFKKNLLRCVEQCIDPAPGENEHE